MHVDQILEGALVAMRPDERPDSNRDPTGNVSEHKKNNVQGLSTDSGAVFCLCVPVCAE